jgi:hypothetical protein
MPDTCVQDYRHQQRGLDAKLNSPLQSAEKLFLLTSPFIEPSPQGRGKRIKNPALSRGERGDRKAVGEGSFVRRENGYSR